jgi:hypothetical protein
VYSWYKYATSPIIIHQSVTIRISFRSGVLLCRANLQLSYVISRNRVARCSFMKYRGTSTQLYTQNISQKIKEHFYFFLAKRLRRDRRPRSYLISPRNFTRKHPFLPFPSETNLGERKNRGLELRTDKQRKCVFYPLFSLDLPFN